MVVPEHFMGKYNKTADIHSGPMGKTTVAPILLAKRRRGIGWDCLVALCNKIP
jgi:hypothetical protein